MALLSMAPINRKAEMTRPVLRLVTAGLLASALAIGSASSASAELGDLLLKWWLQPPPLTISQMRALTPSCRTNPGPWQGRVSGNSENTSFDHEFSVSLVGCFASLEACTLWRLKMSGSMQGRLIYNECRPL